MTPGNAGNRATISLGRDIPDRVVLSYSINIATFRVNVKRENEKNIRFYHKKKTRSCKLRKTGPHRMKMKDPGPGP